MRRPIGWTVPAADPFLGRRLRDNVNREVDRLNAVYLRLLDGAGVKLHMGRGRLMDRHTIQVGEETITAEKILIATGGHPVIPPIPGCELAITSNEAFHLPELPKRITIVGAGYIAVEFAGIFHGLGAKVDLVLRRDRVLRGFDEECRTFVHEALKDERHPHAHRDGDRPHRRQGRRRQERPVRGPHAARRHVRDRSA